MKEALRKEIIKEFLGCPLFDGCDSSLIYKTLEEKALIKTYSSGSLIMSHGIIEGESLPSIAYVYDGKCLITSSSKTNSVLRIAEEKDLIGLAGVFSKEEIETKVVAYEKKVIVLSLDMNVLSLLMEEDKTNSIRNNLFTMLAKKISFLNKKIATLTGGSAEKKLAMFLLSFMKDSFVLDSRKSHNTVTAKADVFLAGIVQLITVLLADSMHKRDLFKSIRKLIA